MPKIKKAGVLTPRQKELLIWFARDCSYKLAAQKMGIKDDGVKSHMDAMRDHLGKRTIGGLLGYAFKTGQISPSDI